MERRAKEKRMAGQKERKLRGDLKTDGKKGLGNSHSQTKNGENKNHTTEGEKAQRRENSGPKREEI